MIDKSGKAKLHLNHSPSGSYDFQVKTIGNQRMINNKLLARYNRNCQRSSPHHHQVFTGKQYFSVGME